MSAPKTQYVALDHHLHPETGVVVGPKSAPFDLLDHNAKSLLESGQVKVFKGKAPKATSTAAPATPGTLTSGLTRIETPLTTSDKPKAEKPATKKKNPPANKKRDLKAENK